MLLCQVVTLDPSNPRERRMPLTRTQRDSSDHWPDLERYHRMDQLLRIPFDAPYRRVKTISYSNGRLGLCEFDHKDR